MILEANSIRKSFREGRESVEVLKGISLSLARGEIVALEGPSGSGKTTLLSIIGCILTPTSGSLSIDGLALNTTRTAGLAAIRRKHIGFVFQQFNLFPALTALENVEYSLNVRGWQGRKARLEATRVLEAVELQTHLKYLPRDMSGGQKQRVAVARALAGSPPLLLADEPTANLDSQVGMQILELFRALAKRENRGLLIVTHDHKVRTIADRVLRIESGHLIENQERAA
jgi:putative ABC transport system ATP-binding protein